MCSGIGKSYQSTAVLGSNKLHATRYSNFTTLFGNE